MTTEKIFEITEEINTIKKEMFILLGYIKEEDAVHANTAEFIRLCQKAVIANNKIQSLIK